MCFSLIAGRKATTTGSVLMGSNDDWPGCPGNTFYQPHIRHGAGETFLTVKGTGIPQVTETNAYVYTACSYETGTRHVSWADGMNEHQVAVGMMGVYSFRDCQKGNELLEADDISILIMERGRTARQAIEMVGALIEEYGYSVSSIEGAEGAVVMGVSDPEEGFFLELVPGGHWIAKRVADDAVECRPNCFATGVVDFDDHVNFICSKNLRSYALEHGWYQEGEPFDFAAIYGVGSFVNDTYGGFENPVNVMRRWDCLHVTCGMDIPLDSRICAGKPERKLSPRDIMKTLTSAMEGTRFDLAKVPEAGRFHNPLWMETSTSVGQGGTVVSMVYDLRAGGEGCMWVGCAASKLAAFVPCFVCGEGLPKPYTWGECGEYDLGSAWWAFQEVGQLCYRNYDAIALELVIPAFDEMEEAFLAKREALLGAGAAELKVFSHESAMAAYEKALSLGKYIKGKFLCNTVLSWL